MAATLRIVRRRRIDWVRLAVFSGMVIFALVTDIAVLNLIMAIFNYFFSR